MGKEIVASKFSQAEFDEFRNCLRKETALLKEWCQESDKADSNYKDCDTVIGLELESWLTDSNSLPCPENDKYLKEVNHPLVVHELAAFNFEMNASPQVLSSKCFSNMYVEVMGLWEHQLKVADQNNWKIYTIGSLPTLRNDMLGIDSMSNLERYRALNRQIMDIKKNYPLQITIDGNEHFSLTRNDIMLEAAATSLQVHYQVPHRKMKNYFNASFLASAPVVATAANSPYLFGHDLWEETRIPIFERALTLPGYQNIDGDIIRRVTFGSGYVKNSLLELFLENLNSYPVLLPILYEDSTEFLSHLRLHNGTIWRWNRPIIGINKDKSFAFRLEHRAPAAGPTIIDVIANVAFTVGLIHGLASQETEIEKCASFHEAMQNFYSAAKSGFAATITWKGQKVNLQELILNEFLPLARQSLLDLGIDRDDISLFIDDIILERVKSGRTGSCWQKSFVSTHGPNFQELCEAYYENQRSGKPTHEWGI